MVGDLKVEEVNHPPSPLPVNKGRMSLEGARDGSQRFKMMMSSKNLEINTDKSSYLLLTKKRKIWRTFGGK